MFELENIGPGIARTWYSDTGVIAYKVTAITTTTLDVWSRDTLDTLQKWPKQRPLGVMFDLSSHGVGIPYLSLTRGNIFNIAILRVKEAAVTAIMAAHPEFQVWFALVLSDSALGTYMLNKGKAPAPGLERIAYKVFFASDAGLQWLAGVTQSSRQDAVSSCGA